MYIYQGDDIEVDVQLTEGDEPLDLTDIDYHDIYLHLYQQRGPYHRFSIQQENDENELEVIDEQAGELRAQLNRNKSQELRPRPLYMEIRLVQDEANFPENKRHTVSDGTKIADVLVSETKDTV